MLNIPLSAVRFAGQAEQDAYFRKLDAFPQKSKERVLAIKQAEEAEGKEGPKHMSLAVAYGVVDKNVRWLNKEIVNLIRGRNKARKAGDEAAESTARERLADLREAINRVLAPLRN